MPTLAIAPRGSGVSIGRLEAATGANHDVLYGCPAHVRHEDTGTTSSVHEDGSVRAGKPADVKPDMHWVLEPVEGGGFQVRPVFSWYEFGRPSPADRAEQSWTGVVGGQDKTSLEFAEAEIRRESGLRKQFADRWEMMLGKRASKYGFRTTRGQIIKDLQQRWIPDETVDIVGTLQAMEPLDALKTLEDMEVPQITRARAAGGVGSRVKAMCIDETAKVAYPEEERLNDDAGLERQKKKVMKALKRKADAIDKAEEDEVPNTANALLQLKSERGEAIWDFSDGEEFSDDEQEKCDFDEQLRNDDEQAAQAPEVDEEDTDAEEGDPLTSHGKELEFLLDRHTHKDRVGEDEGSISSGNDASEKEVCIKRHRKHKAKDHAAVTKQAQVKSVVKERKGKTASIVHASISGKSASSSAVPSPAAVIVPQIVAAPAKLASSTAAISQFAVSLGASSAGLESLVGVSPVLPVTASASPELVTAKTRASKSASLTAGPQVEQTLAELTPVTAEEDVDLNDDELRTRTVACLRRRGGTCKLSNIAAALGLRNPHSPLYKRVVVVLKEVADMERMPGEERPLLMLKPEHWGVAEGPPIPADCSWCYCDHNGKSVSHLSSAEVFGPPGQERCHVHIIGPAGRVGAAWIPVSKAPARSPEVAGG